MASLDESVAKLESFIGILGVSIDKTGDITPVIEEHASALSALEGTTASALRDLNGDIDEGTDQVGDAADGAVEKIEALKGEATAIASERLDQMRSRMEEGGNDFGEAADDAASEVKDAEAEAKSDGFDEVEEAIQDAKTALDQAKSQAEQAFGQFVQKLQETGSRFENNLIKAAEKASGAADDAAGLDGEVESKGGSAAQELQGDAGQVAGAIGPHEEALDQLYAEQETVAAGEKMIERVGTLLSESTDEVRASANEPLLEPVDTVLNDALSPAVTELDGWIETTFTAKGAVADFGLLVDDLKSAQQAMEKIDEALNELGG